MNKDVETHTLIMDGAILAAYEVLEESQQRLKRVPEDVLETNISCAYEISSVSILRFKHAYIQAEGAFDKIPEEHRREYVETANILDELSLMILESMPRMNRLQRKFYDKILALTNSLSLSIRSHFSAYGLQRISELCAEGFEELADTHKRDKTGPKLWICGGTDTDKN